jgi:hypothetical protein
MMLPVSGAARAQMQPVRSKGSDSLAAAIARMPVASRIRFVMHGGERTIANDPRLEGDSMLVKIDKHTVALSLADVDTLWVTNGRYAGRGALLFGIPAAFVGAAIGASFVCDVEPSRSCHSPRNKLGGATLFAAILGAPAAFIGGFLGSAIIRWKPVFVRSAL